MAFGIGINSQASETGPLRGLQKEIACECWFTSTGKVTPIMIKLKDENGEIQTIRDIQIHSYEKKHYAGIPSISYNCTLTINQRRMDVQLIYYQVESRWVLNYTDKRMQPCASTTEDIF